jgi:hypothetical protein
MRIQGLDEEETIIYEWQYGMMGSFYSTLMELLSHADEEHLYMLEEPFPDYVNAYRKYTRISGWWQNVQKKMGV